MKARLTTLTYKGVGVQKARFDQNGVQISGIKCRICEQYISENAEVIVVEGLDGWMEDDRCAYFHKHCGMPVEYHDERVENVTGRMNVTDWRIGRMSLEVETVSLTRSTTKQALFGDDREGKNADEDFINVYFTALMMGASQYGHGQQCEYDCTNHGEHHASGLDLYSFSSWIYARTESELDTMRDERCGCHIHVNCNYTHLFDWEASRGTETQKQIRYNLWNPFLMKLKSLTDEQLIEHFGRTFNEWARADKGCHGDAINLNTGINTVEFRLPHIRTAEQIVKVAKFWRATVDIINDNGAMIQTPKDALKVGRKMARQIDVLMYGTKFNKGR